MKSQVAGTKGPVTFPEENKASKNSNKDVHGTSLKSYSHSIISICMVGLDSMYAVIYNIQK